MPAIVIAAGPSLEKNVEVLKQLKGKAFLIAVDTALGYLLNEGVKPDLAVTVDPEKPIQLFEKEGVCNIPLAIEAGANYKAVDIMSKQNVMFVGTFYPYYHTVFELVNRKLVFLRNGGSVATVAFSMAREWGFQRIVLVGQDLALTPDKVHAGKDDTIDLHKLEEDKIAIEGYNGEIVYTTRDYDLYRRWYENELALLEDIEVVNATEGGAKIKGAKQMTLQEVKDLYCNREFDFENTIRTMPRDFMEADVLKVVDMCQQSIENLIELKAQLKEGLCFIDKEFNMIETGSYDRKELIFTHHKVEEVLKKSSSIFEFDFVDSMVAESEENILDDIYEMQPNNDEEHCRLLEKLKKYIGAMYEAVDDAKLLFQEVYNSMRL